MISEHSYLHCPIQQTSLTSSSNSIDVILLIPCSHKHQLASISRSNGVQSGVSAWEVKAWRSVASRGMSYHKGLTDRPSASSCVMKRLGGSGTLNTSRVRPFASLVLCSTSRAAAEISYCNTFHSTLLPTSQFSWLDRLQSVQLSCCPRTHPPIQLQSQCDCLRTCF